MAASAGKACIVKIGTQAIANIKSTSVEIDGTNLDVTAMGAGNSFISRIQGLMDAKITLAGNYDTADTLGQVALRTAFLAGTAITLVVLPNGTNGFSTSGFISKFTVSSDVAKENDLSIDFEGSGGVTLI